MIMHATNRYGTTSIVLLVRMQATGLELPLVITSCCSAIKKGGMSMALMECGIDCRLYRHERGRAISLSWTTTLCGYPYQRI